VPFTRELAVLVARRPSGEVRAWPVVESVQEGGVCSEVIAPAPGLDDAAARAATQLAVSVAEGLDVTGVLAVELFEVTGPGGRTTVLVNELAMRPHNSGHWTIDGSVTSQFEQHLRAVLDLPLGDTRPVQAWSVMANVLGSAHADLADALPAVTALDPGAKVHLYGKEVRPGRKLGHVTVTGDDLAQVRARARAAAAVLRGDDVVGAQPGTRSTDGSDATAGTDATPGTDTTAAAPAGRSTEEGA
jgi:5-(carboxyamino)imidazole ribonucleotide synthase